MTTLLNLEIYSFLLVFLRFGSAIMLMPGLMSSYVSTRIRLLTAITITMVIIPFLSKELPPPPTTTVELLSVCFLEVTYGIFLGVCMQIFFQALSLAGNYAGQAIGFGNAQIFDPAFQTQSIVIQTFLSMIAITVIFVTDLHHLMFSAVIDSYKIFPAGSPLPLDNFADFLTNSLNKSFIIGFKLSAPFVAFTIIFYTGMGLVSRLMPQLNIFFLSLPLQIYLGLGVLFLTTPIMILWFMRYYEEGLQQFVK